MTVFGSSLTACSEVGDTCTVLGGKRILTHLRLGFMKIIPPPQEISYLWHYFSVVSDNVCNIDYLGLDPSSHDHDGLALGELVVRNYVNSIFKKE